jgi:hypothetical protein
MKRLLSLTVAALLLCSSVGCECCGIGNGGLLGIFRGGRCGNNCNRCNTSSPCNSCGGGYGAMMTTGDGGCGCGGGGMINSAEPIINAPTIAPGPESYSVSHR